MDYDIQLAQIYIGKRVIVSLRDISVTGEEHFSGLWGVIDSAHDGGLLLRVEGGIQDEFWMIPPDLDSLIPAQHEFYQLDGYNTPVVDVDYEAYFSIADSIDILDNRDT